MELAFIGHCRIGSNLPVISRGPRDTPLIYYKRFTFNFVFYVGLPCSRQYFGSLSSEAKCNKLVNGTNGTWLMVDYNAKDDWCESFLTCFNSSELRKRCLKDFDIYQFFFLLKSRQQAFTFEIGTYLPATRIQVNYCPYRYYSFSVNIIHCDSGGRYNGSGTYLIFGYDFLNKNLMLFRVIGSCWAKFETVKFLSQQLRTFCFEGSCNNVGSVSTTLQTFLGPLTRITHVYKVLWVVSFPRCTEGPNIVWSCRVHFLTTANTDATTLNIVGPTM